MFAWLLIPCYEGIDKLLEKHGKFNTLQRFRLSVAKYYWKHDPQNVNGTYDLEALFGYIMSYDYVLRALSQGHESLELQYQSLLANASGDTDKEQCETYLNELKEFAKIYWECEPYFHKAESSLPAGPLSRAYATW